MNIFDQIFGNCEKGIHRFESFEIARIPPDPSTSLRGGINTTVEGMRIVLEALTEIKHDVRCKICGKKPID